MATSHRLLKQRYRILAQLGAGGFGTVYKAEDTQFHHRLVAMKEMSQRGLQPDAVKEAAERFEQEAVMLANLRHPNLARIYDHFTDGGCRYLVMDFIEGETLEEHLNKASNGHLPIEEALHIGIQLCTVLNYLHNCQPPIIFRDLKPSNIMLTPDGHVYLIDFGIARLFKPGQTKDTIAFGSLGYAAPEQYGKAQTTVQSDIYSLGVILHQVLTGNDPTANSPSPFDFPVLRLSGQLTPARLERLIMQMVEKIVSKRPQSMAEIKKELQQILVEQTSGQMSTLQTGGARTLPQTLPVGGTLSLRGFRGREKTITITAGLVAVILIAAFLIPLLLKNPGQSSSQPGLNNSPATPTSSQIVATSVPAATPTQISSLMPSPTPIPTPTQNLQLQNDTYEAESPANTLTGGAVVQGCSGCSGGNDVGYIGPNGGTLQFNNVNANTTTSYRLTIYYCTDGNRSAFMSVNGGTAIPLSFSSTNGFSNVGALSVTINLNAGNNTIKLYNNSDWSPDIDKIAIIR